MLVSITLRPADRCFRVEFVSDRVRFDHEDMMYAAGLSTHVSGQVRMEAKWQAQVRTGKTFILFVLESEEARL